MDLDIAVNGLQEQNQRKARFGGLTMLAVILILGLLPLLTYPTPPPGQEGILVNLGLPDQGQGEENAPPAQAEEEASIPEETAPKPQPEQPKEEVVPETPKPVKEKPVITTEDPEAIALKKRQEEEARQKQQEQIRQREEEAKKKAEEDRKRKEAEERAKKEAEANKLKDQIGGLFGSGGGKGNTGKPGNQGDPDGDPNASVLEGISTGSGTVGGGLGNRGVVSSPKVTDKSQKTGKVVLRVCVNAAGNVTSVDYTQAGSTTSDSGLISVAEKNARTWKFSPGTVDTQCGTITYDFKVR